jgi:E3 ubiquitin-protein ligase HERC2
MCFSGDDSDLCSELLRESLEALLTLPEASLFDVDSVSSVWMEVVERTSRFLRSVVLGELSNEPGMRLVPVTDSHAALCLLLEFAIQKGAFVR